MAADPALLAEARRDVREDYLSALFAPAEARDALLALALFSRELSTIRDRARNRPAAEIRLQWWLDVLAGERDTEAAGLPLARSLLECIRRHALPASALDRMVDAWREDLDDAAFATATDLERWLGHTAGARLQLSVLVLCPEAAGALADLSGHAGCAIGIADMLRSRPRQMAKRAPMQEPGQPEDDAVAALADLGLDHVSRFRTLAAGMPARARPAFLAIEPAQKFLRRVAMAPETAFAPQNPASLVTIAAMTLRALRGW
ncbi:MAG: squalene/phytoene synthase family protein [Rhizobiaceae bacterium]